ncbi:MAG: AAA family ATPase [Blastocatellia bacterium]
MRHFNTTGAIQSDIHYSIPPLERINLDEVLQLIAARKYFVLHAPRQTGKTTCLRALAAEVNRGGQYRVVYANLEAAQAARENVEAGMQTVLGAITRGARLMLNDRLPYERMPEILARFGGGDALFELLTEWSQSDPQPLVLMLDEVDALIGDTLISLLRQVRGGYDNRPTAFPHSVILCGVRDVRDYRIHSARSKEIITGGSAFNIKSESLRLGNFTPEEVERLYRQHTTETGQVFDDDIFPLVWELTAGQPWLVNALAHQATWNMREMRDRTKPITVEVIQQAKEELILRRDTHLDQLYDKLSEERVRRVIEPLLAGEEESKRIPEPDITYVRDLGLISINGQLRIANRIYQEVIPRELTYSEQLTINQEAAWYVTPDGRLDMDKLLTAFQQFFREHSESWVERFDYKEAGPQLLLQAFLQRIVNSGGRVEREYGLGRGRTDLLVIWPHAGGVQRIVLELKVLRKTLDKTITEGLAQTLEYGERCNADELHLVVFDRTKRKAWSKKIFRRTRKHRGATIKVWGM